MGLDTFQKTPECCLLSSVMEGHSEQSVWWGADPGQTPNLPALILISERPELCGIRVCCISYPVYAIVLEQPEWGEPVTRSLTPGIMCGSPHPHPVY